MERAAKCPHIVGCVTYGSPLSAASHYQTGFIRELHALEISSDGGSKPIEPGSPGEVLHSYNRLETSGSTLGSGVIT